MNSQDSLGIDLPERIVAERIVAERIVGKTGMSSEFSKPFRILSLDGGGIRGVVSARILQEVERQVWQLNQQTLDEYFDLIAGTSTGSILAAGVTLKKTSQEMIDLYTTWGLKIFPYQDFLSWERLGLILTQGFGAPKFSNEGLQEALQTCLTRDGREILIKEIGEETTIPHAKKPTLLIPAYDMLYRNTTFFSNSHPKTYADPPQNAPSTFGERWYDDTPLWKICVSSASAPTFFPAFELQDEKFKDDWRFPHVDGGMAANNPSLCAISYAINQGLSRFEDIAVLSIGTGDTTEPFSAEEIAEGGLLGWLGRIVSVFMAGQADVNSRVCEQLMGGWERKRYLRLQFELNQKFDNTKNVNPNAPYKQLDKAEQKNEFIQKKLSEAMDDASPDNINLLIAATAAFLEQGRCYKTRNSPGIPVREAIRTFILESSRSQ
jgi:hypothetical protein